MFEHFHVDIVFKQQGRTPLHLACEKGHTDVVEFLVRQDTDVEAKDEDGNTPLHIAVENKQTVVTTILLQSGVNADGENNVSKRLYIAIMLI